MLKGKGLLAKVPEAEEKKEGTETRNVEKGKTRGTKVDRPHV